MIAFVMALFSALSSVPKIAAILEKFAAAVVLWYIGRSEMETNKIIIGAASAAARARNQEERYVALERWKDALSRPRIGA